ncbi:MAG TPA: DUF4388 domain-containing protein [Vicinamibacteria bacterium]|jgi:hypothetical protein
MSLIGNLGEIALGDALRVLSTGRKTGLLTVTSAGHQALVRVVKGAVVHASSGRLQGEEAVLDLFGWEDGQLAFVPEERAVPPNVTRALEDLITEGQRTGPHLHRMHVAIPSDRVVFQLAAAPLEGDAQVLVDSAAWRVLRLLDGTRDVGEVVAASRLPRPAVVGCLFDWLQTGLLERVEPVKPLRAQGHGSLFASKEAAEMDSRVEEDWRRILRFGGGVRRVEVRSHAGKAVELAAGFRAGLQREVHLPKAALGALGVRDGEEVLVRPVS